MVNTSIRQTIFVAAWWILTTCGCNQQTTDQTQFEHPDQEIAHAKKSPDDGEYEPIRLFCGNCHAFPQPASFPKDRWYDEVRRGFNFYYDSGRSDLQPPSQAFVTKYYQTFAPEILPVHEPTESPEPIIRFDATILSLPDSVSQDQTAISFIDFRRNDRLAMTDLWFSDMKSGLAFQIAGHEITANQHRVDVGGHIRLAAHGVTSNPAATRQVDLDGNGIDDLLIADLGSYLPEDHDRGKVVWIPDGTSNTPRPPVTILGDIGRVAEVQVGDFNGDGRIDVVVGEFGWHKTGSLSILMNRLNAEGEITFDRIQLDDRAGIIHAIPTDINQDGRLDLIALISQEHEKVVAFINTPEGFTKSVVYEAPDPSWGSSGIWLTDFDDDGDMDILYTNGDSFDSYLIKPYHGVWWLENRGSMPFTAHHLAAMPGVHRAIPVDMDLDGDLDVVIASMLPKDALRDQNVEKLHAIAWLERTSSGEFVRHVVEYGRPNYAAMVVGDLDQDGRPDIVVGIFSGDGAQKSDFAKIFWNRKPVP